MFLSQLDIRNFRGIRRLSLSFDETTLLIGENSVGKTSLLEVLDACFGHANEGGPRFACEDFRVCPDSSACPPIELTFGFREREEGEWSDLGDLAGAFVDDDRRRRVTLRVVAEPPSGLDPAKPWTSDPAAIRNTYAFLDDAGQETPAEPEAVAELRRLNPFILMPSDRYFRDRRHRVGDGDSGGDAEAAARHRLEQQVAGVYEQIISTEGPLPAERLRQGLAAIGQLLGDETGRFFRDPVEPHSVLEELVEHPVALAIDAGPRLEAHLQGAGVQSVALLILLGALLEARGPQVVAADAEAIVAVEEPEVHLHPLMLSAVWSVIEGLRAQTVVTTNSSDLMAAARLRYVRRLVRRSDRTEVFQVDSRTLTLDETRKISYHIRLKRDDALFSRCWLLVEGETEFWLLPELARLRGYDFAAEGIHCLEFAQAGVEPLVKLANDLGIDWHLIVDGDVSGRSYASAAARHLGGARREDRITTLQERDTERTLWENGYAYVYHSIARGRSHVVATAGKKSRKNPERVIDQAIRNASKPFLALTVVEQAAEEGSPGVPEVFAGAIESAVRFARAGAAPNTAEAATMPAESLR